MFKYICLFACVAVSLHSVYAVTEDEKAAFRKDIEPIISECSQAHGISKDDIKAAKEANNPDGIPPCFLGCVFKKAGIINADGKYDSEKGLDKVKSYVKNDADLAKFEEVGKKCTSVNDQAVPDKDAGCERAKLLLTCIMENKAEIPL